VKTNRTATAQCSAELEAVSAKVAESSARLKQLHECSPEEARAMRAERGNPFAPVPCPTVTVLEDAIPCHDSSLSVRRYTPDGCVSGTSPALVYFHGGGYVLGDLEQYDTLCQQLAHAAGCIVVSVDYTLAPEAKSQQIFDEAFTAYRWLKQEGAAWGIDTARLAVGGDSAGGNLATAVCLMCKELDVTQPSFQMLWYPVTDYSMSFASVDEFAEGYFLTKASMQWFASHFLEAPERGADPRVSPILADVSGLPPAFVLTAGFDPLRDEGEAFAQRLVGAGVRCRHVCYTDTIHAFISFAGGIAAGQEAIAESGAELRKAFAV
jgi:acetyl esterase